MCDVLGPLATLTLAFRVNAPPPPQVSFLLEVYGHLEEPDGLAGERTEAA